jgi:hypothetical protein
MDTTKLYDFRTIGLVINRTQVIKDIQQFINRELF